MRSTARIRCARASSTWTTRSRRWRRCTASRRARTFSTGCAFAALCFEARHEFALFLSLGGKTLSPFSERERERKTHALAFARRKQRGARSRKRRTLDLVEFVKCYAGLFHAPVAGEAAGAQPKRPAGEVFGDESAVVSQWAKALGRRNLLAIEEAFSRRGVLMGCMSGCRLVSGLVRTY